MTKAICQSCRAAADPLAWRCRACDGILELAALPPFDASAIAASDFSLWRYAEMLPVVKRFSLGEGMTPLVPLALPAGKFLAKLEHLNPTGSFKDRGTAVMLNHLAAEGASDVIDNSSGNAGSSLAAYAGAADLSATVYVPAATAVESKKRLIRAFGGAIIESQNYLAECLRGRGEGHLRQPRLEPLLRAGAANCRLGDLGAAWPAGARRRRDACGAWRAFPRFLSRLPGFARCRAD